MCVLSLGMPVRSNPYVLKLKCAKLKPTFITIIITTILLISLSFKFYFINLNKAESYNIEYITILNHFKLICQFRQYDVPVR